VVPLGEEVFGTQASIALPKIFNEPWQKNQRSAPGNCGFFIGMKMVLKLNQ
jgi:hypothetical protein